MVKTTRLQREALLKLYGRLSEMLPRFDPNNEMFENIVAPPFTYKRFRKTVQPGPGCIMVHWKGMWLGIEPDGYTHS